MRNSSHSVIIAKTFTPSEASYRFFQYVTVLAIQRLHSSLTIGSKTRIDVPSFSSLSRTTKVGASRMSSVSGLKVKPITAIVLPKYLNLLCINTCHMCSHLCEACATYLANIACSCYCYIHNSLRFYFFSQERNRVVSYLTFSGAEKRNIFPTTLLPSFIMRCFSNHPTPSFIMRDLNLIPDPSPIIGEGLN